MGECFSLHIFCTNTVLLLFFILFTHMHIQFVSSSNAGCSKNEWKALMEFKGSLVIGDQSEQLRSWTGSECCSWKGISCHNSTGFVYSLDLGDQSLGGRINSSLLKLQHLEYLDLSNNDFQGFPIPSFLGSLENLQYLNLIGSGLIGEIPPQLGNLTNLQHLSLGGEFTGPSTYIFSETDPSYIATYLSVKSLNWITGLSSLQSFQLGDRTNLSQCVDLLDSLSKLSSLSSLMFYKCELPSLAPRSDVSYVNLTSLLSLDLFHTTIGPSWPSWLFNLTRLQDLRMSWSGLRGPVPNAIEKLTTTLTSLDLSGNPFDSVIPCSLCSLTRLTWLHLRSSALQGSLPSCFGNLTSLTVLLVGTNELDGEMPSELGNLTQLLYLDLSHNNFTSSIPYEFGHLQMLQILYLFDNQLTGKFPFNLRNLTDLRYLYASDNFFTGDVSESSFEGAKSLRELKISRNPFLVFKVSSQWIPPFQVHTIEMDSVFVGTRFPPWLRTQTNLMILVMSNANISGPLPTSNAISTNALFSILQLSGNQISGHIPDELCNFKYLSILSLANNRLTGKIPLCLGTLLELHILDLSNNGLYGHIPMELSSLKHLMYLHLNKNKLSGELPSSLQNLTSLVTFDLGENEFQGCIPKWMGKEFLQLQYLRFESNNFSCEIFENLCQLPALHILNLAQNNLVGEIPPCLGNLSTMLFVTEMKDLLTLQYGPRGDISYGSDAYTDTLLNSIKGIEMKYSSSLLYSKFISLSGNRLHGEIPEELMNLTGLQSLNLSNNGLTGRIPERIDNMKHLESLDLSMNQLSGSIPQSLANTDTLAYLNLSFNNLEGRVPSGNHFDTLAHPSSFEGNTGVCGKLLNRSCPSDDDDDSVQSNKQSDADSDSSDGEFEWLWIYAGIGPGFGVGFLGVLFTLCFSKTWRYAYFRFLDDAKDRVWVTFAIKIPQFTRMFN